MTTTGTTTRIALVTGASRGLGRSMAEHLARAGVGVIGTYHRQRDVAESLAEQLRAQDVPAAMVALDVTDIDGLDAFVDTVRSTLADLGHDHIDHLVNNAGIGIHAPFADTTVEQFDELMTTNVKAPFFLTQKLLPVLADGGRILNVSSGLARFTNPGYAAYASTKGAMEVLTRYQAAELADRQIRVNIIAPGAIATDFGGGMVRDNPAVNAAVSSVIALGRPGEANEIGSAVAALLSDDMAWMNGTRVEVSGGQNL